MKILLTIALLFTSHAQAASSLSGDYRVIDSEGCASAFELASSMPVSILIDRQHLELRARDSIRDASFSIPVGHSAIQQCDGSQGFCFGTIQRFFNAVESADLTLFVAHQTLVDTSSPDKSPRATGRLTLETQGSQTVLYSTLSSQFEPGPLATCTLERVVH